MASGKETRKWLTIEEAAEKLSISPRSVLKMCQDKKMGIQLGGGWMISEVDIQRAMSGKGRRDRTELMGPTWVAERLGVSERCARKLFADGKLGTKVGSRWVATKQEVEKFKKKYEKTKDRASGAKLTKKQVDYIRSHPGVKVSVLAAKFKVAESTIFRIRQGKTWRE